MVPVELPGGWTWWVVMNWVEAFEMGITSFRRIDCEVDVDFRPPPRVGSACQFICTPGALVEEKHERSECREAERTEAYARANGNSLDVKFERQIQDWENRRWDETGTPNI